MVKVQSLIGSLSSDERDPVRKACMDAIHLAFRAGVLRCEHAPCRHCGKTQVVPDAIDPGKP
jgi:hypothetical protein